MKAKQVFYEGRVQGVGFRYTVKNIAQGFDITGMVRNLTDGRVELQAMGDSGEISDFLQAIRESGLAGNITGEHNQEIELPSRYKGFVIQS
jgi:acylphosphatase